MSTYFIAACVFSARFPALSARICHEMEGRGVTPVRCCLPRYKIREFEEKMPPEQRAHWASMPDCAPYASGDTVITLCHNCANILEETHPEVRVLSLYEYIAADPTFPLPDLHGRRYHVQDCWRAADRQGEKEAVRAILAACGAEVVPFSGQEEDFCGVSLYRAQPPRNPAIAPRHYANVPGKFIPHTEAEQLALMQAHCARFSHPVLCYCHYCLEGLTLGGADACHLASLLFPQ